MYVVLFALQPSSLVSLYMQIRLCSVQPMMVGSSHRWSAKKNNSKRSTILQHLLAEPHQQMLQNSSALEIKGTVVRRQSKGWQIFAEMQKCIQVSCSLELIADERKKKKKWKACHIFIHRKKITVHCVSSVNIIKQQKKKKESFNVLSLYSILISTLIAPVLFLSPYITIVIILHQWQIETLFFAAHSI